MNKIIREIIGLLWKLLKLLFWKWVKPILGRVIVLTLLAVGVIVALIVLIRW